MRRGFVVVLVVSILTLVAGRSHADWPQFRGPSGNGVSTDRLVPTKWSESEGIAWRTPLPGLGTSSPIVVGNRIFLTCYSGYAEQTDPPGRMESLMRHVVCLDRKTGKILWKQDVKPELPESEYSGGNNTWHGYSSSTPVSDGKNLFVFFGRSGVFCFDLEGKQLWRTSVGTGVTGWGSGSSPVLFQNLVIVNAGVESKNLVALDKASGKDMWKTAGMRGCWNTPALVPLADGNTELVVNLPNKVLAVDPATGKELWNCDGIPDDGYVCPSAISNEGIVYVIGGRKNTAIAIRAGGRGDVTESHRLWVAKAGANVSSPVYFEGHLYWIHEKQGILNCLDAKTGETVYQERIAPRPDTSYASIVAAGRKLFCVSQHKGVYVFAAEPKFKLLSHNVIADDDSRANASPAFDHGQLLLRSDKYLYCIGEPRDLL